MQGSEEWGTGSSGPALRWARIREDELLSKWCFPWETQASCYVERPRSNCLSKPRRVASGIPMKYLRTVLLNTVVAAAIGGAVPAGLGADENRGKQIYQEMCASCHGTSGEGVADKHDEPLYGDRSLKSLARLIDRTMPEDEPDKLDSAGAEAVAEYIYGAFYSPTARARVVPSRIELARLTAVQYGNAIADLVGGGMDATVIFGGETGLKGEYYNARNFVGEKKAFERVDQQIDFGFEEGSPSADTNQIGVTEFSIKWRGSVIAEESGDYEFSIKTENGARLYVNDARKPLIDAWVSSGSTPREEKGTIRLLAGRAYPITIDFFKYKEKSASIRVEWKAPHKTWEVIPERNLRPQNVAETLVVTTAFPADDGSAGYVRGTTVSKEWDQAVTYAAVEVAAKVVEKIEQLAGVQKKEPPRRREKKEGEKEEEKQPEPTAEQIDAERRAELNARKEKLRKYCGNFAEKAFRRPLSDDQRDRYVSRYFEGVKDEIEQDMAVKKVILLVLKSPQFLYPELPDGQTDDFDIASRLSFALWDSIPDARLLEAAAKGHLKREEQIRAEAERMLRDPRTRAKTQEFFHYWLELEEAEDLSKDPVAYPDFTDKIMADLKTSLELFIEDVVWNEKSDYRQLLTADYLFLNGRLRKFYGPKEGIAQLNEETSRAADPGQAGEGVAQVVGARSRPEQFEKVKFDSRERVGVLTHPYLMSALAYYKSSSPIHRGVFLTRNIAGRALKPPPMAIQFMDGRFDPAMTMRQKVTELTSPSACQSCHTLINPLGFSLENFDGVGRFRTMENGKPVDTVSEYQTPEGEVIRITGPRDVAAHLTRSEDAQRGFVRQMFQHLVKQPAPAYGTETLMKLRDHFEQTEFNIQKLMVEIATVAALHRAEATPSETGGR